MIYGIGTDIVRVARMSANLEKYGERFARRILTDQEYRDFEQSARPAHFLARRFAAKEAIAKAMGIGFSRGMSLRHVGVGHDEHGKPVVEFYDRALELCEELGIGEGYISLADEQDHAVAFVTLLSRQQ
ncbi:MAG: holo-ACP synthase [Granulosicoccaceae bacterium]|jgi:holo-[acyl-carrier protein] synthase